MLLREEPSLINLMVSVDVKHHERKIKIVLITDVSLINLMISVDVRHYERRHASRTSRFASRFNPIRQV